MQKNIGNHDKTIIKIAILFIIQHQKQVTEFSTNKKRIIISLVKPAYFTPMISRT